MKYGTVLLLLLAARALFTCSEKSKAPARLQSFHVTARYSGTGRYSKGMPVTFSATFANWSEECVILDKIIIRIRSLASGNAPEHYTPIEVRKITVEPLASFSLDSLILWYVPDSTLNGPYGIYTQIVIDSVSSEEKYTSFFQVLPPSALTTYRIGTSTYRGFPVFTLDGGMSAEYTVEKSLEVLASGISHSWEVNAPGSGPNPVHATPPFLENSVQQTVALYDSILGRDTPFETVILSPGIPSVPYLSWTLKAPVLPLHFLVSVTTVKELQTILECSNDHGYASYSTLSHDPSVPLAVAWVKLLDMPAPYLNFIERHRIRNVIVLGATGTGDGETKAKKIMTGTTGEYDPRSIYIMYPGTSADDAATLRQKLADIDDVTQQNDFVRVADWESGITSRQTAAFSETVKRELPATNVFVLSSDDLLQLYNLGTYVMDAFITKNKKILKRRELSGVVLNPYLMSHPAWEGMSGYLPVVYWQGNPASGTAARAMTLAGQRGKSAVYWINSSANFGAAERAGTLSLEFQTKGKRTRQNDLHQDEVWKPEDGMEAPCEKIVLNAPVDAQTFRKWNAGVQPLTIGDLQTLQSKFAGFAIVKK